MFEEEGPGIADIKLAMQDGYSTGGGLGMGMPGSERLSNEFYVESTPRLGTKGNADTLEVGVIWGQSMIVSVTDRSLVAEVRRRAADLAAAQELSAVDAGRLAIVATELATNLIKHAGGGEISIGPFADCEGTGVELLALDKGPGIANLQRALVDGHSTAGTAGGGLGAIHRAADVFSVSTRVGRGTAVLARVAAAGGTPGPANYIIASVCAPYPGETVCGDHTAIKAVGRKLFVLLADGSGHGPAAHEAAVRASEIFSERAGAPVEQIAECVHRALAAIRGAAIAIAEIDPDDGQVSFVGVGNISAALAEKGGVRRMVSHNGIAGRVASRIRMFRYPFQDAPTVILHSDGLTARWDLSEYPGLMGAHPSLIAGILYRDYRRGRDDASVVALRRNSVWQPGS